MAVKKFLVDLDLMGNRILNFDIDLTQSNSLTQQLNELRLQAENKSVVVTQGTTEESTTTPTQIKVNIKSGSNDLKLDTDNGLYVTPYTGDNSTIEIDANKAISVKSGVFAPAGVTSDLIGASTDAATADTIWGAKNFASDAAAAVVGDSQSTKDDDTVVGAKLYAADQAAAVLGATTDGATKDTVYGAKAYADAKKAEVIGATTDTDTADTIHGAKAYADSVASGASSTLIGASTDAATADTIWGAKNYAAAGDAALLGSSSDAATADTIWGAKKAAEAAKNAADAKVASVSKEDGTAITVDNTTPTAPVVGLSIAANDKILSQSNSGLATGMSLTDDSTNHKIILYGSAQDAAHKIGEWDYSNLVVDGMLDSVELDVNTHEAGKTFIHFVFNTDAGKSDIWLDVTSLIDVYTGGDGIDITNNVVSLDLTTGNGLSINSTSKKLELAAATAGANEAASTPGAMTAAQAYKLSGIEAGAEVNAIESVTINGVSATIDANRDASATINGTNINVGGTGDHASNTVAAAIEGAYTAAANASSNADSKIAKMGSGNANEVLLSTADGEAARSGYTLGGATMDGTPTSSKLATEAAVAAAISAAAGDGLHSYTATASSGNSITIAKATHGCGNYPIVQCYCNGEQVVCAVAVSSGNVTVSWNGTLSSALTIRLIGQPDNN
jgi:hypothetical protein